MFRSLRSIKLNNSFKILILFKYCSDIQDLAVYASVNSTRIKNLPGSRLNGGGGDVVMVIRRSSLYFVVMETSGTWYPSHVKPKHPVS